MTPIQIYVLLGCEIFSLTEGDEALVLLETSKFTTEIAL